MKLGIIGYGRMGKTVERLAPQYGFSEFVIIDNEEDLRMKQHSLQDCDAAIDFSTPQSVLSILSKCFEFQIPVVSGTTGWEENKEAFIKRLSNKSISFIYGSNFSIGANIFFKLNAWLSQQMKMQSQYTVSIEEKHHIHKKDAPSGTALTIEKVILSQLVSQTVIPVASIREGEIVGEHIVNYQSEEDTIQIKHCAHSRDIFAHGAIKAAVWLKKHPGIYTFEDIFNKF